MAWNYVFGFIILPPTELKVTCFFPVDAESDKRGDNGCGSHEDEPGFSPDCYDSAQQAALYSVGVWDVEKVSRRCRYDLRDRKKAAGNFYKALEIAWVSSQSSDLPNDFKIETWKKGYDPRLPVIAFFSLTIREENWLNAQEKSMRRYPANGCRL